MRLLREADVIPAHLRKPGAAIALCRVILSAVERRKNTADQADAIAHYRRVSLRHDFDEAVKDAGLVVRDIRSGERTENGHLLGYIAAQVVPAPLDTPPPSAK
jgi:hypothetical protein